MKHSLHEIQNIAKKDFSEMQAILNASSKVNASMSTIKIVPSGDAITATCRFRLGDTDHVLSSICYSEDQDGIYANISVEDAAAAILNSRHVPITAADVDDADEDAFGFDSFDDPDRKDDEDIIIEPEDEEIVLEDTENPEGLMEDPETDPDIATDNNIENHYIVECDRCHGIFISALLESDQVVEHVTGVCPLCEKESDQFIKWVIKPVEFN